VSPKLLISYLIALTNPRIKGYHASKNILVYFPHESEAHSNILLVYDPVVKQSVREKQTALSEVEKEILALVATLGQIKTETVSVERRWHEAVTGKNRSTLNAYVPPLATFVHSSRSIGLLVKGVHLLLTLEATVKRTLLSFVVRQPMSTVPLRTS
jgi:hypothetical protein